LKKIFLGHEPFFKRFALCCLGRRSTQNQKGSQMKHLLAFFALTMAFASQAHANNPITCTIRTVNGNYLTAVDSGGRVNDVIHSDAKQWNNWEKFTLEDTGKKDGSLIRYGIKCFDRHFLTAVSGGGRTTDVIHSNAKKIGSWEEFKFVPLGNDIYAIQTNSGLYLTAVGGGGRITDVIHSDASVVRDWEKFHVVCGY
jgi:hypothetical protein